MWWCLLKGNLDPGEAGKRGPPQAWEGACSRPFPPSLRKNQLWGRLALRILASRTEKRDL